MMTLNAAHLSASKPSSSVARIRWPVEDTGMNSVTPSTMLRMIAISRMGMRAIRPGSVGRGQMNSPAGELAAAVEAAKPFMADRRKRGRANPERLEARGAPGRDIVALEHQPLIAGQRRARKPAELRQPIADRVRQLHDVRVLAGQLEHHAVKLDHAHHLWAADLV